MTAVAHHSDIPALVRSIAEKARMAYGLLAAASAAQKTAALTTAASLLRSENASILAANAKDMEAARAKGLTGALLDRLELTPARIEAMASGLETVAALPDPVGSVLEAWDVAHNGLHIEKVAVPLGVIGIIYESRPNVTADAGALCLKSGNAAILRGGSESLHSSTAIVAILQRALAQHGLPEEAIQLIPVRDREAVGVMLTLTDLIDIIVPRGGKSLTERIARESRIATIQHLDGNCHTYIHSAADRAKINRIVLNAKMRRTGVCGATESLLIDASIIADILPSLADALIAAGCALRGDASAMACDARITAASDDDWGCEYLDAVLSIKTVSGVEEAITHINRYGSHHTDAILTEDAATSAAFTKNVDSAIVLTNASTQFADGGEFGFGAEIGISTGRLHARGPVGAAQLTTYKYVVTGPGQPEGAIRP